MKVIHAENCGAQGIGCDRGAAEKAANNLKELWGLLFESLSSLTDEQIENILAAKDELKERIDIMWNFPYRIECEQRYRKKKQKLREKPTEELLALRQKILDKQSHILKTVTDEDIDDSFFEPAPIGSDEHVLEELLRERGAA